MATGMLSTFLPTDYLYRFRRRHTFDIDWLIIFIILITTI